MDTQTDLQKYSLPELGQLLRDLRTQLSKTDWDVHPEIHEQIYSKSTAIALEIFGRENNEDIQWVRKKLSTVFRDKDGLNARTRDFAAMSPTSIEEWRQKKYGGRIGR